MKGHVAGEKIGGHIVAISFYHRFSPGKEGRKIKEGGGFHLGVLYASCHCRHAGWG